MRFFAELAYKGTNYHGWQRQPNAVTVQSVIEEAFSTILQEKIYVTGAGRTDTGVHASFFVLHFDSQNETVVTEEFLIRVNRFLPKDIAVYRVYQVKDEAHTRFDAISRTYKYYISTRKDPFSIDSAYYYQSKLDIDEMNEACKVLFDYEDFTSFSKLHTDVKTNNCKIYFAKWQHTEHQLIFTIKADRFLRNMVRAIVGTLINVGRGKISPNDVRKIIESKNRSNAGQSVPAQGLYLIDIEYKE